MYRNKGVKAGMAEARRKRKRKQQSEYFFDYSLLFIVLFLLGFGLIMIYSASSYEAYDTYGDAAYYMKKQLIANIIGLVPMETILTVIRGFHAVEHRIEFVATKGGVDYYNDSKGTNPDAAIQGIKAMSKPTVLIGGGYDKQSEYDEWIDSFDGKVKCLVLIGQTREKIAECARKHGFDKIRFADTYEECLKLCTELAEPGDAVLLSPACASWGMFPNYEVRGQLFKEYVHGLAE